MMDYWVCTDRALRKPHPRFDHFAYLHTLDLKREGSITSPSQDGPGCLLTPMCSSIPDRTGGTAPTNEQVFNFYAKAKGITMGGPMADFLILKKDPTTPPRWLILEHQDTGDVLLFHRRVLPVSGRYFYPEIQGVTESWLYEIVGDALARNYQRLNQLSAQQDVHELTDFYVFGEWYPVGDGVKAIDALIQTSAWNFSPSAMVDEKGPVFVVFPFDSLRVCRWHGARQALPTTL